MESVPGITDVGDFSDLEPDPNPSTLIESVPGIANAGDYRIGFGPKITEFGASSE